MNLIKVYNTYKIEITGVIAWALFSFAAVRFIPIYIPTKFAHLLTHNICSLVFLFYFFIYYRSEFGIKKFLFLMLAFNLGFHFFNFLYQQLLDIHGYKFELVPIIALILLNLLLCFFVYLIIIKVIKRNDK